MPVLDTTKFPQELSTSPTWSMESAGMTGRKIWVCLWEDCDNGIPPAWAPIPKVSRFAPNSSMFCTKISVEPITSTDEEGNTYMYGQLTADYSTGASVDALPKENWEPYTDIITIGGGRTWASDGMPVCQPLALRVGMERYTYGRTFDWNSLTRPLIYSCVGKINDYSFQEYPAGTLLLETPRITKEIQPDTGIALAIIEYPFIYNSMGWNYNWRSDTGAVDMMLPVLYNTASFRRLPW